jgi:hypothetical protein
MAKKYFAYRNKDNFARYEQALQAAGFEPVEELEQADCLFYDYERRVERERIAQFLRSRPGFIYPHTPYSYWIWDGIRKALPVQCNFVVSEGAKMGMLAYGYPYRVEICGFPLCEVRSFQPAAGKRLLFGPAHALMSTKKLSMPEDHEIMRRAENWIVENQDHFDSIVFRCMGGPELYGLERRKGTRIHYDDISNHELNTASALEAIGNADILIAINTLAYLGLAAGKAIIMYGCEGVPHNSRNYVRNYQLYRKHYTYPLDLFRMNVDEVIEAGRSERADVAEWKRLNIGKSFNPDKFISVVRECLSKC